MISVSRLRVRISKLAAYSTLPVAGRLSSPYLVKAVPVDEVQYAQFLWVYQAE